MSIPDSGDPARPLNEATILENAEVYVARQLETMALFGTAPTLTDAERVELVRKCAAYPLRLLKLQQRAARKAGRVKGQRSPRGICPKCRREHAVTSRGMVFPHTVKGEYHGGLVPERLETT